MYLLLLLLLSNINLLFVTVSNNPSYSNAPLLGNKLPMYGSETCTKKDTSIVTPQPSYKCKVICYFWAITNFLLTLYQVHFHD